MIKLVTPTASLSSYQHIDRNEQQKLQTNIGSLTVSPLRPVQLKPKNRKTS